MEGAVETKRREQATDAELLILFSDFHLTEEEKESFTVEENNRRYGFYDLLLSEFSNHHLTCSLVEARHRVLELIEWFRGLSERGSRERTVFFLRFSEFLNPQPPVKKFSKNFRLWFILGIVYANLLNILFLLFLKQIQ